MAVQKQYRVFIFGDDEETSNSLSFEDLSTREAFAGKQGVFELTIRHPWIETRDGGMDVSMTMTREELAEIAAVCRVLLGRADAEDVVLAEGANAIQ